MKKVLVFILMLSVLFMTGCGKDNTNSFTDDEVKFKEEYESLNGKTQNDKKIMNIEVLDDNNMVYVDSSEVIDIIKNKTGVIYFGFPTCPWCRNAVPVLLDAMKDAGLNQIYYANLLEERDQKHLDEGEIVTDKEGSKNYQELLELLKDHLGAYEGLEDDSIKRLYFPTVLFVKNGKVEDIHIGTVDSQENPYERLTDKEYKELKNIYTKAIKKVQVLTCDTDKTC